MKQTLRFIFIFGLLLVILNTFGQAIDSAMSSLMVYGENFMFTVKEPEGWIGDIEKAKQYHANIIFFKSKEDFEKGGALIQVYNFNKQDERTENDLKYDIESYQKNYPNLEQQDFSVSHKEYRCFSKLVYVENEFYQYIVYINCGSKFKSGISAAMNISKRPATEDELQAFRNIITSLILFKG